MGNSLKKAIVSKLIWSVLGFAVLYLAASTFNLVPQSMKDTVVWFGANFTQIIVATCFLAVLYVIFRVKMRRRDGYE